jgi:hypothetical protein
MDEADADADAEAGDCENACGESPFGVLADGECNEADALAAVEAAVTMEAAASAAPEGDAATARGADVVARTAGMGVDKGDGNRVGVNDAADAAAWTMTETSGVRKNEADATAESVDAFRERRLRSRSSSGGAD